MHACTLHSSIDTIYLSFSVSIVARLSNSTVRFVACDHAGLVWIAINQTILRYDSSTLRRVGDGSNASTPRVEPRSNSRNALEGHRAAIHCMCYVEATDEVWSGGSDAAICVWYATSGRLKERFVAHDSRVFTLLNVSSEYVWSGAWDTTIRVWKASTKEIVAQVKGHNDAISDMKLVSLPINKKGKRGSISSDVEIERGQDKEKGKEKEKRNRKSDYGVKETSKFLLRPASIKKLRDIDDALKKEKKKEKKKRGKKAHEPVQISFDMNKKDDGEKGGKEAEQEGEKGQESIECGAQDGIRRSCYGTLLLLQ